MVYSLRVVRRTLLLLLMTSLILQRASVHLRSRTPMRGDTDQKYLRKYGDLREVITMKTQVHFSESLQSMALKCSNTQILKTSQKYCLK